MLQIALWAGVVELLGLAALPLLRAVFDGRREAALLSRPVGLALAAWGGWALSLLPGVPFSRRGLVIAAVVVAGMSWEVSRRARAAGRDWARKPFWGVEEGRAAALFWAGTAVFVAIRAFLPEILGQEKFMDLAFFNSLIRNPQMPPLDPWLAGRTINYYYWGYLVAAALARLSGVASLTAYNLVIATFGGYAFVAAIALGSRITRRYGAAIWAGIATVFAGNVAGAFDALKAPLGMGFDYWHASRVVRAGGAIDEFPFFTFFQADMHPHLLAFPFFLAAFAVGSRVMELSPRADPGRTTWPARLERWWPAILLAFLAGTARAANNWLLPACAILLVVVCIFRRAGGARLPGLRDAVLGAVSGAVLTVFSLVLWLPYSASYSLPTQGLGRVTLKTGFGDFVLFWGFLLVAALIGLAPREAAGDEASRRRRDLAAAAVAAFTLAAALVTQTPALLATLPFVFLSAALTRRALRAPQPDPRGVFTGFLLLLAFSIIAGCEFVYFRDSYGIDMQRMNTVFKFYNQAWPLLAVPAAVLAARAWRRRGRFRVFARAALVLAAAGAMLYPADAALSRFRGRRGPLTLSAVPALEERSRGDAAAIGWLERSAGPSPVVLEATGDPYGEFARISSHTGMPTVLGWQNHEGLWRGSDQDVADRAALVKVFYEGQSEQIALLVAQKFKITHVVLGDMERKKYPTADRIAAYPFLTPVFSGPTTIYAVHAAPGPVGAPIPVK
jgi:YYY domain-containing protein